MNHSSRPDILAPRPNDQAQPGAVSQPGRAHADPLQTRYVRHAILDARAGLPVTIFLTGGGEPPLAVLSAETSTEAGLARFRAATGNAAPRLLLAPSRAEALSAAQPGAGSAQPGAGAAFYPEAALLTPAALQALADPTRTQPTLAPGALPRAPGTALDGAALQLAKLGRLLPAMLAAPAMASHALVEVPAGDILAYQAEALSSLVRVAEAALPLAEARDARLIAFRPTDGGVEHVALLIGHPERAAAGAPAPLVRIHSECFTGDLLGSLRCDCGPQLHQAIRRMEAEGAGVLLYMAQEGRGIGLVNKLRAYALQDHGLDTLDANRALGWDADERNFAAAAFMLRDLGMTRIRLLTNNPGKVAALEAAGITVTGRLRHAIAANGVNDSYLETKARRFGHLLG
jgi:GTP cyclohydrolase II